MYEIQRKKGLFFLYLLFGPRHILSVWLYLLHILLQMNSFDHVLLSIFRELLKNTFYFFDNSFSFISL